MPPNLGFDRWPRRPADGTPTCAHHPIDTERQHAAWRVRDTAVVVVRTTMSSISCQSSRCPRTKKVVRRPKLPHQIFPAQQHALRLVHTLIATPSCSGSSIPLARLEIWGHLARRPGRRAHRPTHARGDLAPRPLPLYTQTLSRRPDGGTAEPHLRGSRRPTSTTSAAMSRAGRRRSILGSLRAATAKKASLSPS